MELNLNVDDFINNNQQINSNDSEYITLHHSLITSEKQARKDFSGIKELAENIKENGVIQPIIISDTPNSDGKYVIIAGERRWRACKLIDFEIPCIKRSDSENFKTIQIIENLQRSNLTLIEECNAIKELQLENSSNVEQLAKIISKDTSWVSRRLKIANSDDEFKTILTKNKIESITIADELEKIYKIKPKTAIRLVESNANRDEIKKKLRAIKNGINTRVKVKKPKIKMPVLIFNTEEVELISDKQAVTKSGEIIGISLERLTVTGVK